MTQFVELHIIQNFAPSCLNRDDTGAPKDAMFGGYRRSRISSQCLKRASRLAFTSLGLLNKDELGIRTRNVVALLVEKLKDMGIDAPQKAIEQALAIVELKVKSKQDKGSLADDVGPAKKEAVSQTEYLLFLSNTCIDELAGVIQAHYELLESGKSSREAKKAIDDCIGSASAVDVALFGRMLADRKELNVDAAAQVAHAISTHRVDRESDFFTAVDDWTEDDEADAGMLGTVEFNSSCQYRYAVVNQDQLSRNLGGDDLLARKGLLAFLRAAIMAIPSGRQNTFAAHNLPAFIGIAIHNSQPISLANAFEQPVRADSKQSLTAASVARLETHANQLSQAFGLDLGLKVLDLTGAWKGESLASMEALLAQVEAELEAVA